MKPDFTSRVEIDLDRLHQNVDLISKIAGVPLVPVVKAEAYGHGAVAVAGELAKRDEVAAVCVWTVDEAARLRKAGIKGRIIVLGGVFPWQAADANSLKLEIVISSLAEAKLIARKTTRGPARVHFKINTGMTRLGAGPDEAFNIFKGLQRLQKISIAGVMTHLADSDKKRGQARAQLAMFDDILSSVKAAGIPLPPRSAANTAAIFLHPSSRYDLVRPGIGVYGVQEFDGKDVGLKPVLSWKARVALIREVAKAEPVSYGMTWVSPGKRRVAVVCAGYADGYSRSLSNKTHAIIGGRKIRQIGTICMDNCLFDVTGVKAKAGDVVTLIGSDGKQTIPITQLSGRLGTIAYEIMCGISQMTPRVYFRSGKIDRLATGVL